MLSYDAEGRLSGWQNAPGGATSDSFLYDAAGSRVEQQTATNSTVSTTSVYVGTLAEEDTSGGTTTTTDYLSFAGKLVATHDTAWHELLSDQVGTPEVQVGASGTPEALQLKAPYGGMRYAASSVAHLGFTGQRKDATPNLTYFNARYYDQVVGAFLSADTVAAGGLNRYAYVGGQVENAIDPSGHLLYMPSSEFTDGRGPGKRPNPRTLGRAQFDWIRDESYPDGDFTPLTASQRTSRAEAQANYQREVSDGTWLAWYLGAHVDQVQQTDKKTPDYLVYNTVTYNLGFDYLVGQTNKAPVELYTPASTTAWDGDNNWVVPSGIVKGIFDKGQQASIVLVDLSNVNTTGVNLADIGYRAVYLPYSGVRAPSMVARVIFISDGKLLFDYNPLDYGPPAAYHGKGIQMLMD